MEPTDPSRAVADVLKVVRGTSISEIEIEWNGGRVRVGRDPQRAVTPAAIGDTLQEPQPETVVVRSPYVGVFHREPGAQLPGPGESVTAGQTLAEVETLTIRNPVAAPTDGMLIEVLLEDGMPVEYGQPLFVVDPPVVDW